MKTKKIGQTTLFSAFIALALGLVSCGGPAPKENAEKAVNYLIAGELESFYNLLSDRDKEALTMDNFVDLYKAPESVTALEELIPEVRSKAFKAKDFKETITGETAVVTYILTLPDVDQIGRGVFSLQDLITLTVDGKIRNLGDLLTETQDKLKEYIKENGLPTKETAQQINMIRENDEWRVDLDVANALKNKKEGLKIFQ
ncbi:MAG: hypothetical protein SOW44_07780 [Porphyromonas sp.]|nr:hypothetical protein [Bacteroidales bacterium]MDY3101221.1 hypothetical protein [Porphyromonas sp.]